MNKFTPQEIHDLKLTLNWLERETPEKWAVFISNDVYGHRCVLGHLLYGGLYDHHKLLDRLVTGLPMASFGVGRFSSIHLLNDNLGGNKRAILDVLWGLLDKL